MRIPDVIVRVAVELDLIGATFAVRPNLEPLDWATGCGLLSNKGTVSSIVDADFGRCAVYDANLFKYTLHCERRSYYWNSGMTAYLRRELDAMSLDGDGTDVLVGLRNSLIGGRRFCISDIRALFVKWFKLRLLL